MAICEKCKSSMVIIKSNTGAKHCMNCGWDSEKKEYSNKQTNADRIRAMSDEELAEFLERFGTFNQPCSLSVGEPLKWLQSETK